MLSFVVFLVVHLSCSTICVRSALTVQKLSDGIIETFTEQVKLQGIPFHKRVMNLSSPTFIKFSISDPNGIGKLIFKWFLDDVELEVPRFISTVPDKPGNVYSTETATENELFLTIHLQNKGLLAGSYSLMVNPEHNDGRSPVSASGFVYAAPVLPLFPKDRRVLDGDRLNLFCEVSGYPKPDEVRWRFAHIKPDLMDDAAALVDAKPGLAPLNASSKFYTFNTIAVPNDQLLFTELTRDFNGLYECSVGATNLSDETLILVNVKDRWAALWPFIGIVIEVSVLVTAILLYERHQMRSKATKVDANVCPANEPPVPSTKLRTSTQQLQQNNLTVPVDHILDAAPEVTKPSGLENGDEKTDELRLRGTQRC